MSLEIITISSHPPTQDYYCYEECFKSARKYGFEIRNLAHPGEYTGLISKPKILKKALDCAEIGSELILFIDAWDTLFLDDPAKAIDILSQSGADLLFNSEKTFFPSFEPDPYQDPGTPYKYLNSGVFIGRKDTIHQWLKELDLDNIPDDYKNPDGSWHHENDQEYFLKLFPKTGLNVKLDTNCRLCQTLHAVLPDEVEIIQGPRLVNKLTGSLPLIAHANGGGKTGPIMPFLVAQWRSENTNIQ